MRRVDASRRYAGHTRDIQLQELMWMVSRGRHTLWGETHDMKTIGSYREFTSRIPLTAYADIRPWVERMIGGERDILWPGVTRNFAQSSGTSDGKSKYVPITPDSL